ncbi:MAG: hypothetical protein IJJ09_06375 [Synergistaceae bacterium]|nr:hypothetical protein [Synergistaceae bacterium]
MPKIFNDPETGFEISGGFVTGSKCPRCWKYEEHPNEHGLCKRCAKVLGE